jgi:hypothetical protein
VEALDFLLFPLSIVALVAAVIGGIYAAARVGLLKRIERAADAVDPALTTAEDDPDPGDTSEVWDAVVADVIQRADDRNRIATRDILVTKYIDTETLEAPLVAYELESYRDDPVAVRLGEHRCDDEDGALEEQPLGEGWSLTDDGLVFEATLATEEPIRTVIGRPDCPADDADTLRGDPDLTVEAEDEA